jgi:hypothetical protein
VQSQLEFHGFSADDIIEWKPRKNEQLLNIEDLEKIVDQILAAKEKGLETDTLEQKVDLMVYKLYQLNYQEVLLIDPDTPFKQAEIEG